MKADEISPLGLYGNREFFERKQNQGYNEIAFGRGNWINGQRIVAIWALFHPTKRLRTVSTLQYPKFNDGYCRVHGTPFKKFYTRGQFEKYIQEKQIRMSNKQDLTKLLETWGE